LNDPVRSLPPVGRSYKYYDFIMAAFVTVMLCSNLVSAQKRAPLGDWAFGVGVIFFPITYIFGDILTEVYGYARSRRVVWAGFGALAFSALVTFVTVQMPADPKWEMGTVPSGFEEKFAHIPPELQWTNQRIWEHVFGSTWRVVLGSLIGFLCGEFVNSYVMAKMKVWSNGKHLWMRTIGSTIVGELVDSAIFLHIAFLGRPGWSYDRLLSVLMLNYCFKVANEVVMTPVTYWIVAKLKKAENEDHYDVNTDFTPFSLKT
jgi:uncharacterized PurR-regulated membrane protein YhhQ (DUF165 family)